MPVLQMSKREKRAVSKIRKGFIVYAVLLSLMLLFWMVVFNSDNIILWITTACAACAYIFNLYNIIQRPKLVAHNEILTYLILHIAVLILIAYLFISHNVPTDQPPSPDSFD
jgi:hypothetical protein